MLIGVQYILCQYPYIAGGFATFGVLKPRQPPLRHSASRISRLIHPAPHIVPVPMAITRAPSVHDDSEAGDYPSQPLQHQGAPPPTHPAQPSTTLHQRSLSEASTVSVDIEAWTVSALESLSIAPIARGTGSALSIPLDGAAPVSGGRRDDGAVGENANNAGAGMTLRGVVFDSNTDTYGANIAPPRRPPSRRDSMHKRDALLKGKEGSRQRRRWENGRVPYSL